MAPTNNYQRQMQQAKAWFLTYDQAQLVKKLRLAHDDTYIYVNLLCEQYRLSRKTGDLEKRKGDNWSDANTHSEVMTLLDLVCDSRESRNLTGRWKSMESFGLMFHQNLLQEQKNPTAERFDREPEAFRRACAALGGEPVAGADIGYAIELFDGLRIAVQFWHGDEEFAPRLRYLWDENALQYLRYETMYFAVDLLLQRITEKM